MTALTPQLQLFYLDEEASYFTCASMTPMLKSSLSAGIEALNARKKTWVLAGMGASLLKNVKQKAAKILNANPTEIAWVTCTSAAASIAAQNFVALKKLRKNTKIIIIEQQFRSNVYPWQNAAKSVGARMVAIKPDKEGDFTDGIMRELQDGENIILTIPTIHWSNGSIIDISRIAKYIQEQRSQKDLGFFIDATQIMGAVPFDVKQIDPDFFCASTHKWLLGDAPGAIMYVRRDPWHSEGVPLDHHMGNTEAFSESASEVEFKPDGMNEFYSSALVSSAARFNNGGRPERLKLALLDNSLGQIIEWGVANIEATCRQHTRMVEKFFDDWNVKLKRSMFWYPKSHSANIIGIKNTEDSEFANELMQFLKERNIMVASRAGFLRISPFVHNTSAEMKKMFQVIDEFIGAKYTKKVST